MFVRFLDSLNWQKRVGRLEKKENRLVLFRPLLPPFFRPNTPTHTFVTTWTEIDEYILVKLVTLCVCVYKLLLLLLPGQDASFFFLHLLFCLLCLGLDNYFVGFRADLEKEKSAGAGLFVCFAFLPFFADRYKKMTCPN